MQVPDVPTYGPTCTNTSTCLNPPRFNSDVVQFNRAAASVIADVQAAGADVAVLDLYDFVLTRCGGPGYKSCPGFQLPANVHYTPLGWETLADVVTKALLSLF